MRIESLVCRRGAGVCTPGCEGGGWRLAPLAVREDGWGLIPREGGLGSGPLGVREESWSGLLGLREEN